MSDDIRKREGLRDETDEELTAADLAGTRQHRQRDDEASRIENERRSTERTDARTEAWPTGDASRAAVTALQPFRLPRWSRKPAHFFPATKRTTFAGSGTLYKSASWMSRAALSNRPTAWWRER